jgi:3',5'-cyclic AMP phosphodiesterase CpdA
VRTLVHLSDLHFGRIDAALISPLLATVTQCKPEVVVVSGDLTQRARTREFLAARTFLHALPTPQIVVPGNHDVPLYNPFARFVRRLTKYQRYITNDLEPFYADEQIAIVGLNTARSWAFKGGRINRRQMVRICQRLSAEARDVVKIIVTHHPFDVPLGSQESAIVGRARLAVQTFAACGADLLLAGHLHMSSRGQAATCYKVGGYSALIIQADTATSTRVRGEANTFNIIRIAWPHITVERLAWQPSRGVFATVASDSFRQTSDGWGADSNAPEIDLGAPESHAT